MLHTGVTYIPQLSRLVTSKVAPLVPEPYSTAISNVYMGAESHYDFSHATSDFDKQ